MYEYFCDRKLLPDKPFSGFHCIFQRLQEFVRRIKLCGNEELEYCLFIRRVILILNLFDEYSLFEVISCVCSKRRQFIFGPSGIIALSCLNIINNKIIIGRRCVTFKDSKVKEAVCT